MRFAGLGTIFIGAALAWCMVPGHARTPQPFALGEAAATLGPEQYVWRDPDPSLGDVAVVVSRSAQIAYAYRGARLIGVARVSTGKPGKRTPLGAFTILQKRVFHRSNIYSDAPMPYMQRLTWDGIALHAGHNPGYPASHGCIRLPRAFAILLYGVTRLGAAVAVVDDGAPTVPVRPERFPVIVADARGFVGDAFAEVTWRPVTWPIGEGPGLRRPADEFWLPDANLQPPRGGRL